MADGEILTAVATPRVILLGGSFASVDATVAPGLELVRGASVTPVAHDFARVEQVWFDRQTGNAVLYGPSAADTTGHRFAAFDSAGRTRSMLEGLPTHAKALFVASSTADSTAASWFDPVIALARPGEGGQDSVLLFRYDWTDRASVGARCI